MVEVGHPDEAALREDVLALAYAEGETVFALLSPLFFGSHLVSVLAILALDTRVVVCVTFSLPAFTGYEYDVLRSVKEVSLLSRQVSHCLVSAEVFKCDLHQRHRAWLHDDFERSKFVHSFVSPEQVRVDIESVVCVLVEVNLGRRGAFIECRCQIWPQKFKCDVERSA